MFKKLFDQNKLELRPTSKEKVEADKLEVFARLGLSANAENASENISAHSFELAEPQKAYPRRVSAFRRIVPAAAAAAVIAAAIPIGLSAARSTSGAMSAASEKSESVGQKTSPIKALELFYEQSIDDMKKEHPDENIADKINADLIYPYYKPLELTGTNGGLTIKLRGVLDAGFGSAYIVYEFETENENTETILLTAQSDKLSDPDLIIGFGDDIFVNGENREGFGGLRVVPLVLHGDEKTLEACRNTESITLGFAPQYVGEENFSYEEKLKTSVKFEIPFNFNDLPTESGTITSGGIEYEYSFNALNGSITNITPLSYDEPAKLFMLKAVMKDGSSVKFSLDNFTNAAGRKIWSSSLFPLPLDKEEVERIEIYAYDDIGKLLHNAETDMKVVYEAED